MEPPTATRSATVERADLVAGKYFGDVIADSKGSSRSDVVLTITKLDKWSVRITSDYPRLGTVDVTLTRAGGKIVNAGGNAVILMDPNARPLKLEYNPNGEVQIIHDPILLWYIETEAGVSLQSRYGRTPETAVLRRNLPRLHSRPTQSFSFRAHHANVLTVERRCR